MFICIRMCAEGEERGEPCGSGLIKMAVLLRESDN